MDLVGQYIGTYRITAHLGSGGMGNVYLADNNLPRSVAIKVLSNKLTDVKARTRFRNEARAVSSLNHPHILTVHDSIELQGRESGDRVRGWWHIAGLDEVGEPRLAADCRAEEI